jgi:hypothetical protein
VTSTAVIALASNAAPHHGVGWPVWLMAALALLVMGGLVVFKRE